MLIISLVLLQVIIFVVLILVLRSIMSQNLTSATKHLDELNQDVMKKEEEANRHLEEAKQKSQELLAQIQAEAERTKEKITKEAELERDRILAQAREKGEEMIQQADKSRQMLIAEIEERVTKEAVTKACELIQQALPEQFKQEVHGHWINELMAHGFDYFEKLNIPEGPQEIIVVSAFSLTKDHRQMLLAKLAGVLKQDIHFKEEVDSTLVVGLIIKVGSLVLDGSLKNKIKEQVKGV